MRTTTITITITSDPEDDVLGDHDSLVEGIRMYPVEDGRVIGGGGKCHATVRVKEETAQ